MATRSMDGGVHAHDPHSCLCCRPEIFALTDRMTADLTRRGFMASMATSIAALGLPGLATAQTKTALETTPAPTVFKNFRLFDGQGETLRDGFHLRVDDGKITALAEGDVTASQDVTVIDCGGRTLMPGLIDAHWHAMFAPLPMISLLTSDIGYVYLAASAEAERTLMRGFTTVRDVGGPSFALKRAIDEGLAPGPRIFPAGALISQTGGHGDFRMRSDVPRSEGRITYSEEIGAAAIADGPDQVLHRVREQLMLGASQIKLTGGGGVSSLYDPLDTLQFLPEEISVAVRAAADWGTYITAHIYTPAGISRYVKAGARCIEHGQLADEDSVKLIVDHDVWWCLQPFTEASDMNRYSDKENQRKQQMVWDGTDRAYELAIKHKAKVGWGTDILFAPAATVNQGNMLAAMKRWYTPAKALKMATGDNGDLLALSGERAPYRGKLGVIEVGAFADILIVDGDPTEDIDLIADPDANLLLIMKDGYIHKNSIPA
ncbi:metal-dependent hydrolase family protein [Qingshengfaniella alkalisoli]|uniref:Amidohydrolase family protein n=1 Tax=Qingshengfaniella alkalisoli TaxID=2599296 RepID=A0A5B8I8L2_9RHOB|nr:amidohydrolase family protein [Qingshengfaniella alkalisoli]QDY70365.1 amidohydrolase family protein [Qingshengfaniella alkalisoli]